jgi:hypothetical protein
MAGEGPDPVPHWLLRRESAALCQYADALLADADRLIRYSRELRDRIRQFLDPPSPTSTA